MNRFIQLILLIVLFVQCETVDTRKNDYCPKSVDNDTVLEDLDYRFSLNPHPRDSIHDTILTHIMELTYSFKRYRTFLNSLDESHSNFQKRITLNWDNEQDKFKAVLSTFPISTKFYNYQNVHSISSQIESLDSLEQRIQNYFKAPPGTFRAFRNKSVPTLEPPLSHEE